MPSFSMPLSLDIRAEMGQVKDVLKDTQREIRQVERDMERLAKKGKDIDPQLVKRKDELNKQLAQTKQLEAGRQKALQAAQDERHAMQVFTQLQRDADRQAGQSWLDTVRSRRAAFIDSVHARRAALFPQHAGGPMRFDGRRAMRSLHAFRSLAAGGLSPHALHTGLGALEQGAAGAGWYGAANVLGAAGNLALNAVPAAAYVGAVSAIPGEIAGRGTMERPFGTIIDTDKAESVLALNWMRDWGSERMEENQKRNVTLGRLFGARERQGMGFGNAEAEGARLRFLFTRKGTRKDPGDVTEFVQSARAEQDRLTKVVTPLLRSPNLAAAVLRTRFGGQIKGDTAEDIQDWLRETFTEEGLKQRLPYRRAGGTTTAEAASLMTFELSKAANAVEGMSRDERTPAQKRKDEIEDRRRQLDIQTLRESEFRKKMTWVDR
jgi:hypothetical protein